MLKKSHPYQGSQRSDGRGHSAFCPRTRVGDAHLDTDHCLAAEQDFQSGLADRCKTTRRSPDGLLLIGNVFNKMDNVGDGLGVKKIYALTRTCRRQPHRANAAASTGVTTPMGSLARSFLRNWPFTVTRRNFVRNNCSNEYSTCSTATSRRHAGVSVAPRGPNSCRGDHMHSSRRMGRHIFDDGHETYMDAPRQHGWDYRSCPGSHAVGPRHASRQRLTKPRFRQRPDGARGRAGYATRLTATANRPRHQEVFHAKQDKRTTTLTS